MQPREFVPDSARRERLDSLPGKDRLLGWLAPSGRLLTFQQATRIAIIRSDEIGLFRGDA